MENGEYRTNRYDWPTQWAQCDETILRCVQKLMSSQLSLIKRTNERTETSECVAKMHQCCKLGENPSSAFQDVLSTIFRTHARTDRNAWLMHPATLTQYTPMGFSTHVSLCTVRLQCCASFIDYWLSYKLLSLISGTGWEWQILSRTRSVWSDATWPL